MRKPSATTHLHVFFTRLRHYRLMRFFLLMLVFILLVPPVTVNAQAATVHEFWGEQASYEPGRQPIRILFLGDSILAGHGLASPQNDSVVAQVEEAGKLTWRQYSREVHVRSLAEDGETTATMLKKIPYTIALRPHIIIIGVGLNDALNGTDPDIVYNNLNTALHELRRAGLYTMLTGIQAPANHGYSYLSQFNVVYDRLARQHQVVFMPHLMEGVAGNRMLLQHDELHPSREGAKVIADNVSRHLIKMLDATSKKLKSEMHAHSQRKFMEGQNARADRLGIPRPHTEEALRAVYPYPTQ